QYIYVANFNQISKQAFNFSIETFHKGKLKSKLSAQRLKFNPRDSSYTMFNYTNRKVGELGDVLNAGQRKDTVFKFDIEDLTPEVYVAETLALGDLTKFIAKEEARGNGSINVYKVVLYKKYSIPVSAFILTIIAVAVSSMKRRGGMGMNLAIGIILAFSFIFFDKIFGTLAEKSSFPPIIAVWIPNMAFGILAIYLLRNAKR
ncbi:MAG: LptF/LptG family permease, partial [Flavobacterium sp.]